MRCKSQPTPYSKKHAFVGACFFLGAVLSAAVLLPLAATARTPALEFERTKDRFSFAQMYLGYEVGRYHLGLPSAKDDTRHPIDIPQITVGGWHFWGLADFAISVPLETEHHVGGKRVEFTPGVETQFRVYPIRLTVNRPRPFVGAGFNFLRFGEAKGPITQAIETPIVAGLGITSHVFQLELGARYYPSARRSYAVSQTEYRDAVWDDWNGFIGLKRVVDTTAPSRREGAPLPRAVGFHPYFGLGVSSAWRVGNSGDYLAHHAPWLDDHLGATTFPEFNIGVLWKRTARLNSGAFLQLTYRDLPRTTLAAFGARYQYASARTDVEAAYRLLDYQGFVPFVGASHTMATLKVTGDTAHKDTVSQTGLLLGWDIIPSGARSPWLLRTHLRWYPEISLIMPDNRTIAMQNMEFNFIQWVYHF